MYYGGARTIIKKKIYRWNSERRAGGPSQMVGVGDVILTVNGQSKRDLMRQQLEKGNIYMTVAKMRLL